MTVKRPVKDEIYLFFVFFCFYCLKGSSQNPDFSLKQFVRVWMKVAALTIVYAMWNIVFICDNIVENVLYLIILEILTE